MPLDPKHATSRTTVPLQCPFQHYRKSSLFNHCSFLLTTKSYFMSIKCNVEGFVAVEKGFSASFYLLTAGKGFLTT